MAAKSDFAQKLLNDLRLRKERMGVSQSSARNHATTTRDAYRDPGNVHRGSRHTKTFSDSKSMNQQLMSSRGSNQSLNIKDSSSQQIVSYGRQHQHHRSESTGDLSMAFAYAGKLMNVDFSNSNNTNTMINFLNQISNRSLHTENKQNGTVTSLVKHRSQNVPALSTIQIKEISKGVQNLYEIIRSTSNGANVNRYSMEVGKELLKGAKGLEESLRMLVNLQEASELMVNTQRKSRITLLEVDDDKEEEDARSKVVERNQVSLPRFSFDKPSKLSNTDGFSKFPTQQRSAAVSDDTAADRVSYAKPTSEKGRISNVIARLMGLEEVPVKVPVSRNESKRGPQTTSEIVIAGTNVGIPYESDLLESKPKKAFYLRICENETKRDPQITSEIVVPGTNARTPDKSNMSENRILDKSNMSENKPKKTSYSSIQVVLTEQEKQLKEILIKDQLFLSTAEALFKLNIPVGFLHVDENNHHDNETKLKLDCGYEILKRKARSQELSVHPYIKPSIGDTSIKFLDELVKQLYKDLEGVRLYGRDKCNEYNEPDYLHMLENDIHNRYPDINSFWDFGWHVTTSAFVEKDEFVSDVEQDTFSRLVDEYVEDLLCV
ncbi:uncharacterized protein LOC143583761 [Bidens hawaiensis]|uniref:uncharacterized protein LOC143583761 n=1 Tax=Bidens hawaiensis TaxID=980011 RepID=UPI00404B5A1D